MSNKIYGIDLGTTNSLIGRGDELYSGLVPSIVNFNTKKAGVQNREIFTDSTIRSFKKDMSMGLEGKLSIAASSIVLQTLVDVIEDEKVENVVITVPAYFTDNNRQATKKAATDIGLNVVRIINEPTAAAIYYNKDKRTLTLVYDLGGGTFDISLIDNRLGPYEVVTTDGNKLGGDNLDIALRTNIMSTAGIAHHRLSDEHIQKLKLLAEEIKVKIQKTRQDVTVSMEEYAYTGCSKEYTLTVDTYKTIVRNVFRDTVKKTKRVIKKYIPIDQPYDFLLVGGSTRDPFLREWLIEELYKEPVPLTYDPDKAVALGAALAAKLLEEGKLDSMLADIISKPIGIGMLNGTVKQMIPKDARLPITETRPFVNVNEVKGLELSVYQGDSIMVEGCEFLGNMNYDYGRIMEPNKGIVNVTLTVSRDGTIELKAKHGRKKEESLILHRTAESDKIND